jgi:site-specific DNA recombinase
MPSENPTPLAAVLYAAKSTEDQHGSIPTQLSDCREMARREGWEIIEECVDEGFSAYSGNRGPGLERARRLAVDKGAVLLAQHSDRVARGAGDRPDAAEHLVEVVTSLRRAGAQLRTVQDDFFAHPSMGLVMAALMGQRNTEDSRRKSEAVKAGKRRTFERGEFGGGPPPDGFELVRNADRRELRIDPDRIDVIRLIGDLSDQGWGDPSIARELNRRGHRTKGGGVWARRRIQDLLTNAIYYGGVVWRRHTEDEEINWNASHPAPWTREDYGRRVRARANRDRAKGTRRNPKGRPHANHALAGLATCGACLEGMRPITSTYRRKDGTRRRTYVCRNVHGGTGLCDAAPIDAELVDTHIVNALQRYLGDFERWRDQLLSGYANERERLAKEVDKAREHLTDQEGVCAKRDRLPDLAEDEGEMREALRLVREASEELERRRNRLTAAQTALKGVPTEAPADAMLDFYNELGNAVSGRLEGASTLERVNDALKDVFDMFVIDAAPDGATFVTPVLIAQRELLREWSNTRGWVGGKLLADANSLTAALVEANRGLDTEAVERLPLVPPLRTLQAPSAELANAQL